MIEVRKNKERKSIVGLVLAFAAIYIIWGSTYLAIRFAIETIPPFLMLGVRFFSAGILMYAWLRWRGAPRPRAREWAAAAVLGGLLLAGGTGAVAWSVQWIPSGLAALLVAMVPMWMALLDWLRPGGRRLGAPAAAGLLLGLTGVVLLIGPVDLSGGDRSLLLAAGVLALGSLSWSIGSVYSQKLPLPRSPFMAAALQMTTGGLLLAMAGTSFGEWARFDPAAFSVRSTLAVAYLVIFGSLIAFAAYVWLLKYSTPARVGSYAYVNPVVAVFLGWALAAEPISARTIVAAAIIIMSVVLIISFRSPESSKAKRRVEASPGLGTKLFEVDENIRYVAVNQNGRIVEMEQNPRWPSHNPEDTDKLEELVVNPAVLDLTRRRGELDLDGLRYVVVRYGMQYQLLFPYRDGHLSVGVEHGSDVTDVARKVSERLGLPV